MNLKEICLKEKPTHRELFFIVDTSFLTKSIEEINCIVDFCCNHLSWAPVVLNNLKRNKFCDEELFLKIKAITKVNELTQNL